jgi:indolepyruvate ferredoxin oxidoreductase alpha subunit
VGELSTDIIMNFFSKFFNIKNKSLFDDIRKKEKRLEEVLSNLPIREPTFCPGCQYRPIFYSLKKRVENFERETGKSIIYGGDIGCYTLSEAYPYEMIDWIICMGAGIGIANGLAQTIDLQKQKLIAFIGDSTLYHTGIQPILNAVNNNLEILILIFNNYWTAMTGHQTHFGTPQDVSKKDLSEKNGYSLPKLLEALNIRDLTVTRAYNIEKLEKLFDLYLKKKGVRIIVINEECALKKKRRIKNELRQTNEQIYYKITDACVQCNECIETLGCPAINAKIRKDNDQPQQGERDLIYYIDESHCIPQICPGICKDVCKNNAILKTIIIPPQEKKKKAEENVEENVNINNNYNNKRD